MSKKVLITGGLGYLGGRLAQELVQNPAYALRLATRRTAPVLPPPLAGCEVVPFDFDNGELLGSACSGIKCVVHLAALNENDCAQDSETAFKINVIGTLRLLDRAIEAGVEKFVYFSTAHVYGAPLAGNITEETVPRPVHPYAITHKTAEDLVLATASVHKISGIVFRLANGFGAPIRPEVNRWTLLVNDLCRQAVRTRELRLKTHGLQQRNFITLSDVCQAVTHFLQLEDPRLGDGVFNLGAKRSLTILEMTELIANRCEVVLGFRPPIHRPLQGPGGAEPPLEYSVRKANLAGFAPEDNYPQEIDDCLRCCQRWFG